MYFIDPWLGNDSHHLRVLSSSNVLIFRNRTDPMMYSILRFKPSTSLLQGSAQFLFKHVLTDDADRNHNTH